MLTKTSLLLSAGSCCRGDLRSPVDLSTGRPYSKNSELSNPSSNKTSYPLIISTLCLLWPWLGYSTTPQPATAQHAMVSTAQHLATEVGLKVLRQGGNAIDAAVAVGYALAVVEPADGNIGGGGFMLIRLANGETRFINFRETAPAAATTAMYLNKQGNPIPNLMMSSYKAVAIPGTVAGLNYALKHYGGMSLPTLMQPAIMLAEQGYKLEPGDITDLSNAVRRFNTQPNVAAIFTKQGKPYQVGDKLIQHDLAKTLTLIATKGDAGFYQGKTAEALVKASQQYGGVITLNDLANYHVETLRPLTCTYRGYQIISAPPPSSGGVTLCEMLAVTQAFPLTQWGYRTAESSYPIIEAMRYAFNDRDTYLGDPNFVQNPITELLSTKHINHIIQAIKTNSTNALKMGKYPLRTYSHNTTHYSIIDKDGNAVAVTYTLNNYFGTGLIAGETGFFLNNEMDDFTLLPGVANEYQLKQSKSNNIQPGKRPLSSMTPTIVLKDNQLFLVLGAPGGSTIITQILETLENIIDYGMNIQEAIDVPRYHMQASPNLVFIEPNAFSNNTQRILQNMGYRFKLGPPFATPNDSLTWGAVAIVERDPTTGKLYGAIDKRRPAGLAKGY